MAVENKVVNEEPVRLKKRSQLLEIWKRMRRNRLAMVGLAIVIILALAAIFAPFICKYTYDKQDLRNTLCFPNGDHWLGTDNFGRDLFARIVYGARVSLIVGFISVGIGIAIGGTIGAVAAFYGGKTDNILMRIMDIMSSIPNILLAISISAMMGPGLLNAMIAVGVSSVPAYARVARSSVITIREQEFVEAARAIGGSDLRIIFRHVIPNSLSPVIVQATLGVAGAILVASSLSFLGLGVQPPTPEWGSILSSGRAFIREFWPIVTFPGIAIMVTIIALNLLGDGLRDALDPKLKR